MNLLKTPVFTAATVPFVPDDTPAVQSFDPRDSMLAAEGIDVSNFHSTEDEPDEIVVSGKRDGAVAAADAPVDNRLRLSALSGRENDVYGASDRSANILTPLHRTGGLLFPYTPSVSVNGETSWSSHDLVHTNYDVLSYQRTASAVIGITGKFTVQNQREGEYALAVLHFLRVAGKMYYGDFDSQQYDAKNRDTTNTLAGLPPPVLRLRGYGTYMFNDLKCVLKSYSYSFEEGADLVTIKSPTGGTVMIPPMFSITLGIGLQQNPSKVRKQFALNQFRTGALMKNGGWF
ncbi:MAG: hypothetical protein EOO77_17465 [Oxalobacteraceae bacterium]|nr:MAG: hypothetical protein EOO77_17465 [Oxalobacteraceae bacterium]